LRLTDLLSSVSVSLASLCEREGMDNPSETTEAEGNSGDPRQRIQRAHGLPCHDTGGLFGSPRTRGGDTDG